MDGFFHSFSTLSEGFGFDPSWRLGTKLGKLGSAYEGGSLQKNGFPTVLCFEEIAIGHRSNSLFRWSFVHISLLRVFTGDSLITETDSVCLNCFEVSFCQDSQQL